MLNYKKIINFIYMGTMGIGLAILTINPTKSVIHNGNDRNDEVTSDETMNIEELGLEVNNSDSSIRLMGASVNATPTLIPSPTPIPTPTPLPVYAIEEEGYPSEIDTIINTYYDAKVCCDMDTLKTLSSDPSAMIDKEDLEKLVEGIDDYKNIKCYVQKSYIEGTYIVYAYHEIQFIGLTTLAPGLSKLYIVTNESGDLKIFDGVMEDELKEYFAARNEDPEFLELKEHTDNKAEEVKADDEELGEFWDILDNY